MNYSLILIKCLLLEFQCTVKPLDCENLPKGYLEKMFEPIYHSA